MRKLLGRKAPLAAAGVIVAALALPGAAQAEKGSTVKSSPQLESRGFTTTPVFACGPTLVDSSAMIWDLDYSEGYVSDGGSEDGEYGDTYDSYGYAYLSPADDEGSSESYSTPDPAACTTEDDGREIVYPVHENLNDLGVDVARKVYVPATGQPFARWLDILSNPGTEPVTFNYEWYGNYGETTGVTGSADGSLDVALGERWASFIQDGGDPDQASLWDGPGAVLDRWDSIYGDGAAPGVNENDDVDLIYKRVTIPAGGRAIFMHVEHQNRTAGGALAFAVANDDGTNEFFAGMSPGEVRDLRNWSADGDADGVLNDVDNCREVANADQANTDGDAQGDACDDDLDNDGLPNAIEKGLGSKPNVADTDGDGKRDGVDSCPTLAGAAADGCPTQQSVIVLQASAGRGLPTGVSLNVRVAQGGQASSSRARAAAVHGVTVRTTGRIGLPAGTAATACAGGRIAVVIKQSKKTISTRVVNVNSDCSYRSTVAFRRKLGRGELRVKSYFFGSQGLVGRAAKSKTVRLP